MGMIKIASSDDWAGLRDRRIIEVKVSSRGLLPGDSIKLSKEVGDRFIHEVRKAEDTLDTINHKYAHVISCGCTELFGPNRNADGWGKVALERDMASYLKNAKCFRDHKNGKSDLFYGRPKVAFFDGDRGYGRLLCGYFATSKAADEHLARIADLEINELDRGESFKVSHGTKIPFDTCSMCGNEAPTRSKYCAAKNEGGECSMFGCKTGLTKMSEEGEIQFVHNDAGNIFYDISAIGLDGGTSARQADRIAFASAYDVANGKIASDTDHVRGSAWLSEQLGLSPRPDLFADSSLTTYQQKMAAAAIELASQSGDSLELFDNYDVDVQSLRYLSSPSAGHKQAAAADLIARREMIGPRVFAKVCGADRDLADEVAAAMPGIYQRIVNAEQVSNFVRSSAFTSADTKTAMAKGFTCAPFASVSSDAISYRRKLAAVTSISVNTSSISSKAAEIASEYAALKVAMAAHILASGNKDLSFLT